MPFPLIQDREPEDYWNGRGRFEAPGTWVDSLEASAESALDRTGLGAIGDLYVKESLNKIEGQKTLSIEELNDKYDGQGITWTSPHKEATADYIAKEHDRKRNLQRRIEIASGGVGSSVANFAAGMFVQGPEMMLGGAGVGGLMKGMGLLQGSSFAARAGMSFAENAIGTVPIEAAGLYRDRQMEMDISLTSSLTNIILGGVLGVGIEGLRTKGFQDAVRGRVGRAREKLMERISPTERAQLSEVAALQIAEGKRPMLSPMLDVIRARFEGKGPRPGTDFSGRSTNQYTEYGMSTSVSGRFYNGIEGRAENMGAIPPSAGHKGETNFGVGQYGTTDVFVENGRAVPAKGVVHQFDVAEANLAPADQIVIGDAHAELLQMLKNSDDRAIQKLGEHMEAGERVTLRDVYEALPGKAEEINQVLRKSGYEGIHFVEGEGGAKRNGVMIFPEKAPERVKPLETLEHDPRFLKEPTPEEMHDYLNKYHARENDLFHSQEVLDRTEAQAKKAEEIDFDELENVEEKVAEVQSLAKEMADGGVLSKEGQEMLAELEASSTKVPKGEKTFAEDVVGKAEKSALETTERTFQEKVKEGESIIKAMGKCVVAD